MRLRDRFRYLYRRHCSCRSKRAFHKFCAGSVTILWARFLTLVGMLLSVLGLVADLAGAPGIQENITALLEPKYIPYYLIAISLISEMARRRTLNRDRDR